MEEAELEMVYRLETAVERSGDSLLPYFLEGRVTNSMFGLVHLHQNDIGAIPSKRS